jgi:hypothetical protein
MKGTQPSTTSTKTASGFTDEEPGVVPMMLAAAT